MKHPIKKGYLKGYYGYKNFGDELLALGVIRYLFDHYPLEILYIEVEDKARFLSRLERHAALVGNLLSKVKLIEKTDKLSIIKYSILTPNVHKFLGGGEVFSPARGWFHGGWNLYILHWLDFIRHNVTLLGGVSIANNRYFRLLYSLTLSSCDKIILREKFSYEYVVSTYHCKHNTILYNDFGHDIISSQALSNSTALATSSISSLDCPYLIVNTNPYVDMSTLTGIVVELTSRQVFKSIVYFPGDKEDMLFFAALTESLSTHKCTLFDWTKYDIWTIISLVRGATYGVGVRLHILSMFQRIGIPYEYLVYQEKIDKFLASQKN